MNLRRLQNRPFWFLLIIPFLFMNQCRKDEAAVYNKLRRHADQISVIDTHEHQQPGPEAFGDYKFKFYHLVAASYLAADLCSSGLGVNGYDMELIDSLNLDELWAIYGNALDYSRGTSYYSHLVKGFRKLYGFNDLYFTKENIASLSTEIEENYRDYKSWFNAAFEKAGYERMFVEKYWNGYTLDLDTEQLNLVFNINQLISDWRGKPEKGSESKNLCKVAEDLGYTIYGLDEYLSFCDHLLNEYLAKKVVCLKNSQAYGRSIYYEDVPYEDARTLFNKPTSLLTLEEAKKIEDYIFHWIVQKSIEYELPIQIHTGFLAGNWHSMENGHPMKLNKLFLKYPKAKFVLFHGGFPWTGEFIALGKMFPNVYLDLVWLPQISRERAVSALDEMLDCVPYNKIFWGGDCHYIEESVGSLEIGKDVVSEVLAERVIRGLMTEEVAHEVLDRIFRENAIDLFHLKQSMK